MSSHDLLNEAIRLIEDKEFEKAINLLEKLIKSQIYEAWYYLGIGYFNLQKYDQSFEALSEATNFFPEHVNAWIQKGIVLQKLGRDEEALETFDEALLIVREEGPFKEDVLALKREANFLKGIGLDYEENFEQAKSLSREVREKGKIEEKILVYRGLSLRRLGKIKDAIKSIEAANSIQQNKSKNFNIKGIKFYNRGNLRGAKAKFIEAAEEDNNFSEAWNNLALIFYYENKYDAALKNFKKAIKINQEADWAWNNIGVVLQKMGEHKAALKAYNHALKINSFNQNAWYHKIIVLSLLEKPKEGLKAFNLSHEYLSSANCRKNNDNNQSQNIALMI
jgi:tetratricopeptide (TPR) repeat protein